MGMYQTIHEPIAVAGVYRQGKFEPKKFQWGGRTLPVKEVTLVIDSKDGGVRKRHYSILSGGNVYRLCFNREAESWLLEEMWME